MSGGWMPCLTAIGPISAAVDFSADHRRSSPSGVGNKWDSDVPAATPGTRPAGSPVHTASPGRGGSLRVPSSPAFPPLA